MVKVVIKQLIRQMWHLRERLYDVAFRGEKRKHHESGDRPPQGKYGWIRVIPSRLKHI
jgi:hypothetical protein